MFKLREAHYAALRKVAWAQIPQRMLQELHKGGKQATWDSATRTLRTSDRRGFETQHTFSPEGLPRQIIDPSGAITSLEHDERGRMTAAVRPEGTRVEKRYDDRDNIIEVRIGEAAIYRYESDEQNRLLRTTFPDGFTVNREYDEDGLLSVTDQAGGTEIFTRDNEGRIVAKRDALGRTTRYTYTPEGALSFTVFPDESFTHHAGPKRDGSSRITGRDGRPAFSEWDDQGRLLSRSWSDGRQLSLSYDSRGSMEVARTKSDTIQRSYDNAGRLVLEESSRGAVRRGYDADDRLTSISCASGESVGFDYDANGRIAVVRDWSGGETLFSYASDLSVRKIRFPNGVTERRESSIFRRPSSVTLESVRSKQIRSEGYAFDAVGRITEINSIRGFSRHGSLRQHLSYDPAGRLTTVTDPGSRKILEAFSYDLKGNMIRDNGTEVRIGLMDEPRQHPTGDIVYHPDGSIRSFGGFRGPVHCHFSADGTVAEIMAGGESMHFEYDAFGRRISKRVGQRLSTFGWCGLQLLWEEIYSPELGRSVRRDYLFLPEAHTPLAFREEGRIYWMHSDVRGAVVEVTDESGRSVWSATYDSFGCAKIDASGLSQPWRLCGHYEDNETGLYYCLARYYSPRLKSFLSIDPRWEEDGATNYSYARNDPWNHIDPSGAMAQALVLVGGGPVVWIAAAGVLGIAMIWAASQSRPCFNCGISIPRAETDSPPRPPSACEAGMEHCLDNPWQPSWNRELFGPRKDCGACNRECRHSGVWPEYKCPH